MLKDAFLNITSKQPWVLLLLKTMHGVRANETFSSKKLLSKKLLLGMHF